MSTPQLGRKRKAYAPKTCPCGAEFRIRDDELPWQFKARVHCTRQCANEANAEKRRARPVKARPPKQPRKPRRAPTTYTTMALCRLCGEMPWRLPVGAVCVKCGTVGADYPPLVCYAALMKSPAGMMLDHAPDPDD